jgi:2-amino-4-hydroxy-6-hydroxymethyldihydropteridine diphosphokinase
MLVFLGLGSNLGERRKNLLTALEKLGNNSQINILACSKIRETPPYGKTDQPDFLNCAVKIQTTLSPAELLHFSQKTEDLLGRIRSKHWGPRIIDIDILYYGNKIVDLPQLKIPHPEIPKRKFVLEPLNELSPNFIDPISKKNIKNLYKELLCRN